VKLISLRRYLDLAGGRPGKLECTMPCAAFAQAVLPELGAGQADVDLDEFSRDAAAREAVFERVLERVSEWRDGQARREEETRREMQQLLAAFNQAVMALADGGERAAGRFSAIGEKLEKASRAESMAAMRAAVYEASEALRRESEAHRKETVAQVEALGRRLEEARQRRGVKTALAGIVFDRLAALESRFGKTVAQEAVGAFEAERIAGRALGGRVYAWTPQMRVWLIDASGDAEAVRDELEPVLGEPFEYRTMAGGRTVMLTLEGRWMWGLLGRTSVEALIEEVDLFAAGAPTRR
jgi:hypothetical protein